MWIGMVIIVGCYGLCAAVVHSVYYMQRKRGIVQRDRFIIVTQNNQTYIEWYLHSLQFFSQLRGRAIEVAIFDRASGDETLTILNKLAEEREYISLYTIDELEAYLQQHEHTQLRYMDISRVSPQEEPLIMKG